MPDCVACNYPLFMASPNSKEWVCNNLNCIQRGNLIFIDGPVRNGLPGFYQVLDEAADTHEKKSHDYANNADPLENYREAGALAHKFKDPTDAGLAGRLSEKFYRFKNLGDTEALNESIEETLGDIIVIAGLLIANRRERRERNLSQPK